MPPVRRRPLTTRKACAGCGHLGTRCAKSRRRRRGGLASPVLVVDPGGSIMSKNQILVAYDFTRQADVALQSAVELACRDPQNVLHFVTVVKSDETYLTADRIRDSLVERLALIFRAREPRVDVDFCVHTRLGFPDKEILALAEEIGADLIIVGSHDRGPVGRLLIGSVSEAVLRGAHCPVLVARLKGYAHVELQRVIEVPHEPRRAMPHRYSYTSAISQTRPNDWPI
jgi:nucleotide-binding universal stress UspA family protein